MTAPRVFDGILVQGDRRTIQSVDEGKVYTTDEAGMRFVFDARGLAFDEATACWYVVPMSMLRCSTCGVLLTDGAPDCGFCGELVSA